MNVLEYKISSLKLWKYSPFQFEFIRLQQAEKSCQTGKKSTSSNSIFQKSCMSTIDVSPGVSGVSKNQGGLTEYDFDSLKC